MMMPPTKDMPPTSLTAVSITARPYPVGMIVLKDDGKRGTYAYIVTVRHARGHEGPKLVFVGEQPRRQ